MVEQVLHFYRETNNAQASMRIDTPMTGIKLINALILYICGTHVYTLVGVAKIYTFVARLFVCLFVAAWDKATLFNGPQKPKLI